MESAGTSCSLLQGSTGWGEVPSAQLMSDLRLKSPDIYDHCIRVALLSERIAMGLNLQLEAKKKLLHGCFLHDIGKLLLPDELLTQLEPLSHSQWDTIKTHPELGARILEVDRGIDKGAIEIIRFHHERWDGKGYPYGLKGKRIPYLARICSVIDAFDCMVTGRPYRKSMTMPEAREELIRQSGTQFDEQIVQVFVSLLDDRTHLYA